jgi:hypothetical protein
VSAVPVAVRAQGASGNFTVKPADYDPGKTYLVQAAWLHGTGCATDGVIALPNADFTGVGGTAPYQDPACPTGDAQDRRNEGLLLFKTGPTANFAAAVAVVNGVKGRTLTELGFDIRKPVSKDDPRGSHCGAGAPRFNVATREGGFYFIGCQALVQTTASNGWVRLRTAIGLSGEILGAFPSAIPSGSTIESITIVFDEGQDAGPDNFGAAILDNIDVNGVLVGRGPVNAK